MTSAVTAIRELVAAIDPVDALEHAHLTEAARWLAHTDDVFRRVKPATPPRHLVSYVVVVDPGDGSVFLVDHIKAGLWLPPGGHVEPQEHPARTARREAEEELGIALDIDPAPLFLTITTTINIDAGHEDVSLWYVVTAGRDTEFTLDPVEFHGGRWWSRDEIEATEPARFDPHLRRFLTKLHRRPESLGGGVLR